MGFSNSMILFVHGYNEHLVEKVVYDFLSNYGEDRLEMLSKETQKKVILGMIEGGDDGMIKFLYERIEERSRVVQPKCVKMDEKFHTLMNEFMFSSEEKSSEPPKKKKKI
jgi:hypothetical protein